MRSKFRPPTRPPDLEGCGPRNASLSDPIALNVCRRRDWLPAPASTVWRKGWPAPSPRRGLGGSPSVYGTSCTKGENEADQVEIKKIEHVADRRGDTYFPPVSGKGLCRSRCSNTSASRHAADRQWQPSPRVDSLWVLRGAAVEPRCHHHRSTDVSEMTGLFVSAAPNGLRRTRCLFDERADATRRRRHW